MRVRRLGFAELVTTGGLPSAVRLVACILLAGAVGTVGFTLGFVYVAARDGASLGELAGVAVAMLVFYGPATSWEGGWWSIAAILVAGLAFGVLTHRYRVSAVSRILQRTGRVVLAVLLIYAGWVLVVGVAFLAYARK